MELNFTRVFKQNYDALNNPNISFICNIGTSRSSKTWSILQLLIITAMEKKVRICVVRESMAVIKENLAPDIDEILEIMGLTKSVKKLKEPLKYTFPNGSVMFFNGTEDINRLKGAKRDILYINEASNISKEAAMQIFMRTTAKTVIDLNPDIDIEEHWIGKYLRKPNAIKIESSWKNNPFLTDENIENIKMLCEVDENYYRIYALGLPAIPRDQIYNHFKEYDKFQFFEKPIRVVYGIDQGHNHPSTIVKTYIFDNNTVYAEELLYQTNLSSIELIYKIKEVLEQDGYVYEEVYVDSAVPEVIKDLKKFNINAKPAIKDVQSGINYIRSCRVFVEKNSTNLWKEYKNYKAKTSSSNIFEEPIKKHDDLLDAFRYSVYSDYIKNKRGKYNYFIV